MGTRRDLRAGSLSMVIGKQLVPTPMMEWSSMIRGETPG